MSIELRKANLADSWPTYSSNYLPSSLCSKRTLTGKKTQLLQNFLQLAQIGYNPYRNRNYCYSCLQLKSCHTHRKIYKNYNETALIVKLFNIRFFRCLYGYVLKRSLIFLVLFRECDCLSKYLTRGKQKGWRAHFYKQKYYLIHPFATIDANVGFNSIETTLRPDR